MSTTDRSARRPARRPTMNRRRRREAAAEAEGIAPPDPVRTALGIARQYTNGPRSVFTVREFRPVIGRRRRGLFVTFEGIEGSGKSTQVARVARALGSLGVPVLATREPGGTAVGLALRDVLLGWSGGLDAEAELLLMFADRRQHLAETVEPALAEGRVVLSDRYTDASRAYQGAGRGVGEGTVDALHRRFCRREPDVTYLLDCPVETALARVARRGNGLKDRFESEDLAFHRRVRTAYRRRARTERGRFVLLDARLTPDEVFGRIWKDLVRRLAEKGFLPRGACR
jgi:dTMP kinase